MKLLGRLSLAHRGWRYRLRVDPDGVRWMCGVLRPGDVAVDVGAYKGGYMYWMRRMVGGTGAVHAFEPQPELAAYLRDRIRDSRWTNVEVVQMALSAREGTATLLLPASTPSPAASLVGASLPRGPAGYDVRTTTLDEALDRAGRTDRVRLIKCDVEGHELDVLKGAARTLELHRPFLLLECEARHLRGHGMVDVFGYLERLGYSGSFFWKGRRLAVGAFNAAAHQIEGRRPYANNFAFVPEEAGR